MLSTFPLRTVNIHLIQETFDKGRHSKTSFLKLIHLPAFWHRSVNSLEPRRGQRSHLSPQAAPMEQQQSARLTGKRPPPSHLSKKNIKKKNFRLVKEFHQMHRIIINITQNGRHSVTYLYGFTVSAPFCDLSIRIHCVCPVVGFSWEPEFYGNALKTAFASLPRCFYDILLLFSAFARPHCVGLKDTWGGGSAYQLAMLASTRGGHLRRH
jgi:hypothetical protein